MSSTDLRDVNGKHLRDRASGVLVPTGITCQDELEQVAADAAQPDLANVEAVLRTVAELTGMSLTPVDPPAASAAKLRQDRQPSDPGPVGWSPPPSRLRPGLLESLFAIMTSVLSLMEEIARVQRETAGILRALEASSGNGAAVQRLRRAEDTIRMLAFVQNGLLAQLDRERRRQRRPRGKGPNSLGDPLTAREEAVLRFLAGTLSLREIGQEMYVSRNTVKSHTRAIYQKLGVASRPDAIRRGHELAILPN
jgi:DNA-binding CsgD family transcriptional regulator